MEKMETIVSLAALLGVGYGVYRGLKWMMQAGSIQTAKNPPLSPNDLKVLEESAERLMADLRLVTDECVARIELALADAQSSLGEARPSVSPMTIRETPAAVVRDTRMMRGEAELLEGLRTIGKT